MGVRGYGQAPIISYNHTAITFNVGLTVDPMYPTNTGGHADSYSVNPALPAGLRLDNSTGVISGTPNTIGTKFKYSITSKNKKGESAPFILEITVDGPNIGADPKLTYPQAYPVLIAGVRIPVWGVSNSGYLPDVYQRVGLALPDFEPRVTAASAQSYTITPTKLPAGLAFNTSTGEITGTPSTPAEPVLYQITAKNDHGNSTAFQLGITVIANEDVPTQAASIEFVGQGDIQQSLNTGAKIQANTGVGVIYRENSRRAYGILHHIEVDFSINVASTVDTIKSINDRSITNNSISNKVTNSAAFGNSVLLPLNSGQAFSFAFTGYLTERGGKAGNYQRNAAPKPIAKFLSGFKVTLAGSNRNWEYDSLSLNKADMTTIETSAHIVKTSLLSGYAGLFYEFITPKPENNYGQNASITLGAGLTGRWILGDVRDDAETARRTALLNSNRNSFIGYEIQLGLRFYNIKAEVHLPFLPHKDNIPGLSGTQMTTFIGFSGGFPIDLTKKTTSSTNP